MICFVEAMKLVMKGIDKSLSIIVERGVEVALDKCSEFVLVKSIAFWEIIKLLSDQ